MNQIYERHTLVNMKYVYKLYQKKGSWGIAPLYTYRKEYREYPLASRLPRACLNMDITQKTFQLERWQRAQKGKRS
jgi:hypothetical protein